MPGGPVGVLVVAHDAAMGGAQLALLECIRGMVCAGFRPIVVAPTPGPFVDTLRAQSIPCYWGMTQRWIFFRKPAGSILRHPYLWSLLSLLTLPLRIVLLAFYAWLTDVRLIYTNTITVIDGALVARLLSLPHVWHLHEAVSGNDDLDFPGPTFWVPGLVLACSEKVIVTSRSLRDGLFQGFPQHKVRVIYNGTDLSEAACQHPPSILLEIPAGAPVTAIVGRLNANKGITDYLKAVQLLQASIPAAHHLVIGEGTPEYSAHLRREVFRMGLEGCVHFLGYRPDARTLLSRCTVLVSASRRESFGRTLIEAMAAGIPVIATRSGGPEEIVIDGETGFLVNVGDVASISARMRELLVDRELAAALGNAGRRRAIADFSLEQATRRIVEVMNEALSGVP